MPYAQLPSERTQYCDTVHGYLNVAVGLLQLRRRLLLSNPSAIPGPHTRAKRATRAAALGSFCGEKAGHVQRHRVRQDLVLEPRVPVLRDSGGKGRRGCESYLFITKNQTAVEWRQTSGTGSRVICDSLPQIRGFLRIQVSIVLFLISLKNSITAGDSVRSSTGSIIGDHVIQAEGC